MITKLEAQVVLNSNFNNGNNWNCSPEMNPETVYGGSNSANMVAEIDAVAGLCQTISGFTVGATYTLTFDCARRTGSPTFKSMDVTVDGGALSVSVSRNGTPFVLANESFSFVATATTHTLAFSGSSAGTLGLLVDNINISFLTILPMELLMFDVEVVGKTVEINWATLAEIDNDFFVIERSANGEDWMELDKIEGAGNSINRLDYQRIDETPLVGYNYYRLKQVDYNGNYKYSKIQVVKNKTTTIPMVMHPNPTKGIAYYQYEALQVENLHIEVLDLWGGKVRSEEIKSKIGMNNIPVNLVMLPKGIYVIRMKNGLSISTTQIILQ